MKYSVWTGNDLFVMIFKEDVSGNPEGIGDENDPDPFNDTPLFSYCIATDVSISGENTISRRAATGRRHRKLVPSDYEYSATVNHLYLKIDELDRNNVFARKQYIAIYFIFLNYVKTPTTQKEWHAIRKCMASSFSISSKENGIATCSASFAAEEYASN